MDDITLAVIAATQPDALLVDTGDGTYTHAACLELDLRDFLRRNVDADRIVSIHEVASEMKHSSFYCWCSRCSEAGVSRKEYSLWTP